MGATLTEMDLEMDASFASSPPLAPNAPGSVMAGHLEVYFICSPDALAELEKVTPKTSP